jgi:hypothetical protein
MYTDRCYRDRTPCTPGRERLVYTRLIEQPSIDIPRGERRLWGRALLGVCALVAGLAVVYAALLWRVVVNPPKQFTSHSDQIAADLRANGVNVRAVYVDDGVPGKGETSPYSASIRVHAPDTTGSTPVPGRVMCRVAKRDCWYQIYALGVGPRNLPDLASSSPLYGLISPEIRKRVTDAFALVGIDVPKQP